jgi:hypothetical protein
MYDHSHSDVRRRGKDVCHALRLARVLFGGGGGTQKPTQALRSNTDNPSESKSMLYQLS